jgi:hypothetical protein
MRRGIVLALAGILAGVSMPAMAFQQWTCTAKDSKGAKFSAYYDGIFETGSKKIATENAMAKCAKESKAAATCAPLLPVTCVRPG